MSEELKAIRLAVEEMRALLERATEPKAVNLKEAARLLGVSTKHIGRMVRRGELLTTDVGGARRIPMEEINRLASPVVAKSNSSNPETVARVKYDAAAASRKLAELRKRR